jgi:hypothetical protein
VDKGESQIVSRNVSCPAVSSSVASITISMSSCSHYLRGHLTASLLLSCKTNLAEFSCNTPYRQSRYLYNHDEIIQGEEISKHVIAVKPGDDSARTKYIAPAPGERPHGRMLTVVTCSQSTGQIVSKRVSTNSVHHMPVPRS